MTNTEIMSHKFDSMSTDEYMEAGWRNFPDGRDWFPPDLHDLYDEVMADPSSEVVRNCIRVAFGRGHADGYDLGYESASNDEWEDDE